MPYFLNTFRTPKLGKEAEVVRAVRGSLEAIGGRGMVNVSMSSPNAPTTDMRVVGTLVLDDESAVDELLDLLFENDMEAVSSRSNISEMCSHENWSLSKVIARSSEIPEGFAPKYINRHFVPLKRGKLSDAWDLLSEWGESIDHRYVYNVSVPLGGPVSMVRVTHILESFASMQELNEKVFSDPRQDKFQEMLSGSVVRSLGRVTYSTV